MGYHVRVPEAVLPPTGCLMALDHGSKRIGLAVCDARRVHVFPIDALVIENRGRRSRWDAKRVIEAVVSAANEHGAVGFVVGLPLNMDGTDSDQTRAARSFAERLAAASDRPVQLVDERLTTAEARWRMAAAGPVGRRGAGLRDSLAAAAILENYLRGVSGCDGAESGDEARRSP